MSCGTLVLIGFGAKWVQNKVQNRSQNGAENEFQKGPKRPPNKSQFGHNLGLPKNPVLVYFLWYPILLGVGGGQNGPKIIVQKNCKIVIKNNSKNGSELFPKNDDSIRKNGGLSKTCLVKEREARYNRTACQLQLQRNAKCRVSFGTSYYIYIYIYIIYIYIYIYIYIISRYAEICPDMCRYAQTCKI